MTLSEFKAWFEGYTESLEGAPTEKQFKRIKAKVAEITGAPITQTVWVDRYHHYWNPIVGSPMSWGGVIGNVGYSAGSATLENGVGTATFGQFSVVGAAPETERYRAGQDQTVEWDSHAAMYAVGKADAIANAA
jgi:hypothetical protein